MTPKEAKAKLRQRPLEQRTRRILAWQLIYEERPGVHTYHDCPCGRMLTRGGECVQCLEEMLAVAKE